jgi:hypothetical protein
LKKIDDLLGGKPAKQVPKNNNALKNKELVMNIFGKVQL